MKTSVLILCAVLSGCVAYPAYYPTAPDPNAGRDAANAECAKSGKAAVLVSPTTCDGRNCTTRWVCR